MSEWPPLPVGFGLAIFFLLIGSFLNVLGIRVWQGKSVIRPRSHCPSCKTTLQPSDLVPVFSYLWTLGKCRYCGERISPIYPLGEIVTMVTGLLLVWKFGFSWELAGLLLLFCIGIAVSVSDLQAMLIPNKIIVPGIGLILLFRLAYHPEGILFYLLGAVLGGGILLILALLYPQGMGMGDVKLFIMMGLGLGWVDTFAAMFLASLSAACFGLIALALRLRKKPEPIPFGPFIVGGGLVAVIWGSEILTNYWNLTY